MNRDAEKSTKLRSQKVPRAQQQVGPGRKKKDAGSSSSSSSSSSSRPSAQTDPGKEVRPAGVQGKKPGKGSPGAAVEIQRKLSDASNTSEDLSKDSGCLSGKVSSSDSSSEISDCPSEGHKDRDRDRDREQEQEQESRTSRGLSWIEGGAYQSPAGDGDAPCVRAHRDPGAPAPDAATGRLSVFNSSGSFMDLMMGDSTEELVREVEELRSENEYLKDEVEELRCEMLEMRDQFQEEEVFQLQELRLQLDQALKTCRILQYRLRKAQRRSIRGGQGGGAQGGGQGGGQGGDGELVRSLEHDVKVAKSVSLRLFNELESVQEKKQQLEVENETLREATQQLQVEKEVLQVELDKHRESSVKKRSLRPSSSKEKRLSQQIEDDSDLRLQLHLAKEELTLMCKKLSRLVLEGEAMREELGRYRSTFGDVDSAQTASSAHSREVEVKVHLKLVEEEATLLSRRIVELEVENRGLRAEMSDLREKMGRGGGGGEDDEEEVKDREGSEKSKEGQENQTGKGDVETSQVRREGPVGGEWTGGAPEGEDHSGTGLRGLTPKDLDSLVALRGHCCVLTSAVQLLTSPPAKNGHCSSPSCTFSSPTDVDLNGKSQIFLPGPLNEALDLLQAMLLAFITRVEMLLTGEEDPTKVPAGKAGGRVWDSSGSLFLSGGDGDVDVEDLRTAEVKERDKQSRQSGSGSGSGSGFQWDLIHSCRDPRMELTLKVLRVLHQWSQEKGAGVDGKEGKAQLLSMLRSLLQDVDEDMKEEMTTTQGREAKSQFADDGVFSSAVDSCSSEVKTLRRHFSPPGLRRRNWVYVSREAAQLDQQDQQDPVKTWDHLIMPPSFPGLDLERMSRGRSHTAPETSGTRIYYSPPSHRRVQLAQTRLSPVVVDRESVTTAGSPWCTPPTSFSQLCPTSSANLSDDMKEVTGGWRQAGRFGSPGRRGRALGGLVDSACSGTQTLTRPQMVSVGLQTEGGSARSSPSRVLSTSLISARNHHISTSLDGVPGRLDRTRTRTSTSSPKLYRRHSTSALSSLPSSTNLTSSASSTSTQKERALWNLNHHSHSGLMWTRQPSPRSPSAQSHASLSGTKPPPKPAAGNRYGMVTEFLRRVSGRVEKAAPCPVQVKSKGGAKNLERVPSRSPAAAPLHRNDSVTRIVNQRFMKQREDCGRSQREECGRSQREEKGGGLSPGVRQSLSSSTEDGNYDCSSTSSLTFCFSRPSRSNQRQNTNLSKPQRHRFNTTSSSSSSSTTSSSSPPVTAD